MAGSYLSFVAIEIRRHFLLRRDIIHAGKGGRIVVVYLDLAFLLNGLSDAKALYLTARLSGLSIGRRSLFTASVLGGTYGALSYLPQLSILYSFPGKLFAAILLVKCAFGRQETFFRIFVLFFILSCSMGGAMLAISQAFYGDKTPKYMDSLDWKVFFLVGGMTFFLLSAVFRGSARHIVAGEICSARLKLGDNFVSFGVLMDTGHTLCDPYSGEPVLTVWHKAVDSLWNEEEQDVFAMLEEKGALFCAEKLCAISPGKFRLLPYRAVGVKNAVLLAFRADEASISKNKFVGLTVALSPTPVSDGEGYSALWGGERNGEILHAVSNESPVTPSTNAGGLDPS